MKIFHTWDLHLNVRRGRVVQSKTWGRKSQPALSEAAFRAFEKMVSDAVSSEADVFVIAWDVFHHHAPTKNEVERFAVHLGILRNAGISVVVEHGNHDQTPSSESLSSIHALYHLDGVYACDPAASMISFSDFKTGSGEFVRAVFLPYLKPFPKDFHSYSAESKAEYFSTGTCPLPELVENAPSAESVVKDVLLGFAEGFSWTTLLVGHVAVNGAETSGEREFIAGKETFSPSKADIVELAGKFGYVALGHFHKFQEFAPNAAYCGSPLPLNYSEAGDSHGYVKFDTATGKISHVPLSGYAEFFRFESVPDADEVRKSEAVAKIVKVCGAVRGDSHEVPDADEVSVEYAESSKRSVISAMKEWKVSSVMELVDRVFEKDPDVEKVREKVSEYVRKAS